MRLRASVVFAGLVSIGIGTTPNANAETPMQLANGFGHIKNSWLMLTKSRVENHRDHVEWALNNEPKIIKAEASKFLRDMANFRSNFSVTVNQFCQSFGYLKDAKLSIIDNKQEPREGHIQWCKESANTEQRNTEYASFVNILIEKLK